MGKLPSFLKSPPILIAIALVVLVAALALTDWPVGWRTGIWEWLGVQNGGAGDTNGTTLRNVGLIAAGFLALFFAFWRSVVADRQARASQQQAEAARTQAETARTQAEVAQRVLLNDRYQQGAEMLGSNDLAVRLGGIYALERLAKEHPREYHVQIMNVVCAFVCNPHLDGVTPPPPVSTKKTIGVFSEDYLPPDRKAVLRAIATRSDEQVAIERELKLALDLSDANLKNYS